MHFPIDVIFLDDSLRIVGTEAGLPPGLKKKKGPSLEPRKN